MREFSKAALAQWLLHPTLEGAKKYYGLINKGTPIEKKSYFLGEMGREICTPLLNQYFAAVEQVPEEDQLILVRIARAYTALPLNHCAEFAVATIATQKARLTSLVKHPAFVADQCAVEVMCELADLPHCEPWDFEMYSDYTGLRYQLRPGFGAAQLAGFQRLVGCDRLWTGRSKELRRVFFASVALALQHMSEDENLLLQAAQARIDLMLRNKGEFHEPECKAAFRERELEKLRVLTSTEPDAQLALELIQEHNLELHNHLC